MRGLVEDSDRSGLLEWLEDARRARINLPVRAPRPEELAEIRVPVPDRPGVLAEVTTLVGELGVNMFDFETVHSSAGDRGVLVFLVEAGSADLVRGALLARGYKPSAHPLG
jgi:prephenate dehydrogenase